MLECGVVGRGAMRMFRRAVVRRGKMRMFECGVVGRGAWECWNVVWLGEAP
jgi:hypothetical protein